MFAVSIILLHLEKHLPVSIDLTIRQLNKLRGSEELA